MTPNKPDQTAKKAEVRVARVDAAHAPREASPLPATSGTNQSGPGATSDAQQPQAAAHAEIVRQAREIEAHLRNRQHELDHRESQLNARTAEFERESRAARLWLVEQERELAAAQKSLTRTASLQSISDEAQKNQQADDPAAAKRQAARHERDLDIENREFQLLERERVLRRCRDELSAAREETLEIRLATEELWRQLCDALPPEAVTKSVARIRQRLADHYKLAREDLNDYREQLESVRCDLDRRLETWSARKADLASWVSQRMEEIDKYHAAVADRAAALDQRQSELDLLQAAWRHDRQELETRVERLQRRLDQSAGAPRPHTPAPHIAVRKAAAS